MEKENVKNDWAGVELADSIWEDHIEVFRQFDLAPTNGNDLTDETSSTALFSSLVTLDHMDKTSAVQEAIDYLKLSQYYSEDNYNSDF